jgi:uncharacterized coiled-coil protein SlyX
MDDQITNADLKVAINKLVDSIEKLTNRIVGLEVKVNDKIKTVQTSVDLVAEDRKLLEKLSGQYRTTEELVTQYRDHIDTLVKDLKADITDVKDQFIIKADEVKKVLNDGLMTLTEKINTRPTAVIQENVFTKFKKFLFKMTKEVN